MQTIDNLLDELVNGSKIGECNHNNDSLYILSGRKNINPETMQKHAERAKLALEIFDRIKNMVQNGIVYQMYIQAANLDYPAMSVEVFESMKAQIREHTLSAVLQALNGDVEELNSLGGIFDDPGS